MIFCARSLPWLLIVTKKNVHDCHHVSAVKQSVQIHCPAAKFVPPFQSSQKTRLKRVLTSQYIQWLRTQTVRSWMTWVLRGVISTFWHREDVFGRHIIMRMGSHGTLMWCLGERWDVLLAPAKYELFKNMNNLFYAFYSFTFFKKFIGIKFCPLNCSILSVSAWVQVSQICSLFFKALCLLLLKNIFAIIQLMEMKRGNYIILTFLKCRKEYCIYFSFYSYFLELATISAINLPNKASDRLFDNYILNIF